ncbi:MAG: DUF6094 domain-containing protein [Chloroflexi bacterium]|nr:DUF6094 domain-containing protein [Chloroflexota bacterium]
MTRLASTAKAGFFPTPERVTEMITRFVEPSCSEGRILDPCCGEGIAVQCAAEAWHLESFGIEIDAERALAASSRLHRVLHLDYASVRIPHHAFQVLFLNPPYDSTESEGRRTEYTFLRDTTKWLQPGGLLIYIVPQYRTDARMAGFLATAYESIRAYRFPDPDYAQFRQAVLFGLAKKEPVRDEATAIALLQQCRSSLAVLPEQPQEAEKYQVPAPVEGKFYFRGTEINPQEAFEEAQANGAWKTAEWQEWLVPRRELSAFRPLMPLKKGHLAMLIAAGLMQNLLLESADGSESLLVKGRTYKVQEHVESDDENEEITRDRFVTEIVALNLKDGSHKQISDPSDLAEFVDHWRDALTQKVMQTFVPLYQFDLVGESAEVQATLNRLSKHRHVPGRKETGLFPAQKHVAVALWKRLQQANSAILVGEMGVGKSSIAAAVSELIRECDHDARPTLILAPPHLVNKWIREIQQIVPMAFAMPLYRLADVTQFARQIQQLSPGTPAYAVLSKEMAKLGGGWRPACVIRHRYERVNTKRGGSYVEKEQVFACPQCGYPVYHVEGGQEISLVRDPSYFEERKRYCSQCREPLFQMMHLNGATLAPEARLLEAETRPITQRYPIAEFIARRYRGFFKLLVADEIHQMKGQSTDQGYALGSLVRACNKTLALTGTIFGGRSTSLFFLLHRLSPPVRAQFKWTDAQRWAERFGILEKVIKHSEGDDGYGTFSGKHRRQTYVRELPGASPELVSLLLDSSAFLSLADLGFELPAYQEYPEVIAMAKDQRDAYDALEKELKEELKERLNAGDKSLLAAYLQSLLAYPNSCFREEIVEDSNGDQVASAPALGEGRLFPKEEWLVELAQAERNRGRRVLVFVRQTGTRDITDRLARILGRAGLRADVLKASVGTQVREEWLRRRVGKGMIDVLITNPRLVETGLDLVDFQTTVWLEQEYSLYTLMQASRRTWRIGQVQDVDVYFPIYRDTMEHRAASLVGQKLAAAQLIYGDSVQGALVDQADSGHGFLADLARSVIEDAQVADLSHLFRQVSVSGGNGDGNSEFIGATLAAPVSEVDEISAGAEAALEEPTAILIPASTRQMAMF